MFTQTWQLAAALMAVVACLTMFALFVFSADLPLDGREVDEILCDYNYENERLRLSRGGLSPSNPTRVYRGGPWPPQHRFSYTRQYGYIITRNNNMLHACQVYAHQSTMCYMD